MAADSSQLIALQLDTFEEIKRICVNYSKDSPSRKTVEYLDRRIAELKAHWEKFQANDTLLNLLENKDISYFKNDTYANMKIMYEKFIQDMRQLREQQLSKQDIQFEFGDIKLPPPPESQKEKKQALLCQQIGNFKAFERAASKINLSLSMEKWELEDNLNILTTKWGAIEKIHWELNYLLQGEEPTYEQEYNNLEGTYETLKKDINKKIWSNAHYEKGTPRMEIPEFHGNYNQWLSFKSLFIEGVHTNPLLSNTQKMQHLKSKLKGEPEKLIQHLNISPENYSSCWEIITHRYDNQRMLFTSYMNTLLNQPAIHQANADNMKKLHDVTLECVNGLNNIGLDTSTWDPIIVHLLSQKLDSETYKEYVKDLRNPRDIPDFMEFISFLESKFIALETLQGQRNQPQVKQQACNKQPNYISTPQYNNNNYFKRNNAPRSTTFNKYSKSPNAFYMTTKLCPNCKTNDHVLMQCENFLAQPETGRNDMVSKLQLCKNCLFSHGDKQCKSRKTCKVCYKNHHTLLHITNLPSTSGQRNSKPQETTSTSTQRVVTNLTNDEKQVLLTTVQIQVRAYNGTYVNLRGLLDQGSQVCLITEEAAQLLQLPRQKMSAVVSGIGSLSGNARGCLQLECRSLHSNYSFNIEALIMRKLINKLPSTSFSIQNWSHLDNLKLADPEFNSSKQIDILLGADVYAELILDGLVRSNENLPVAQQTKIGWILCGNVKTLNCLVTLNDLDDLTRFWESEDINDVIDSTTEEEYCEKFYVETTERQLDGRYIVKMPMKTNYRENLGKTRPQAIAQFLQLERKMDNNYLFASEYKRFMTEYITMGHMTPVTSDGQQNERVFLPHHGILKTDSTTTKLRAVFNASFKTNKKLSLNDLMYTGPNLQQDMLTLLINWRTHRYVFTADVEKMYRQIVLHEDQRHLQSIIWRASRDEPIREWQLCTVTYGTKAAPYLAMRTLRQLSQDERDMYPDAANVLTNYFYMDDLVHGQDNIESAQELIEKLILLLKKGGFNLRKWTTNEPIILKNLPEELKCQKSIINFKQNQSSTKNTKTLGIAWEPTTDTFQFEWELPEKKKHTKRTLLAEISKLWDPVGWLSPLTIKAKLIFQQVWTTKTEWDEPLPENITKEWESIRSDLPITSRISLPRWLRCTQKDMEIHGFCDASERAYACVAYSRTLDENGDYNVTLITAKTKVAPIKKKLSMPRMELNGALLLAKLIEKLRNTLKSKNLNIYCWSDSKVVLAWLQGHTSRWERYVANRVTQITCVVPASHWRYVKSNENSADCASRGLSPSQLVSFDLWWEGPRWLKSKNDVLLKQKTYETTESEEKVCCINKLNYMNGIINKLLNEQSTLLRVTRVVSWLLRVTPHYRIARATLSDNEIRNLSLAEQNNALIFICREIQKQYFGEEIDQLKKTVVLSKRSHLIQLTPYIDKKDNLLRVGGRLSNSTLPEETKHPIILPSTGRLTELIILEAHARTLHGGARLTAALVRSKYWIVSGNKTVKKLLRQCVKCHRFRPHKNEQIMANLPKERVTASRPFTNTGVDFTGHVDVKINKGRGVKTCKGYIAIFVCMVTKAVHIELVSDLSTETFLAAFKRMCSRRGTPKRVFSDNGTNFVGAARQIHRDLELHKMFTSPEFHEEMKQQQVEWHFNAPLWPSAGGLWEAAVKSMKYHLKRVIGEQKLTFEQFTTLLAQIEACLNSRPLSPLTEDIDDLDYLTPGHFLIGGPITSLPSQAEENFNKTDLRNRWKLVEHMHQHFWKRWSQEYIHHMQVRSKWRQPKKNLEQGDVVLLKEDNLPPAKWSLGRVEEVHPGSDGNVRVVTVKTKRGSIKRPITKLAPLPIQENLPTTSDVTDSISEQNEQPLQQEIRKTKKPTAPKLFTLFMIFISFCGTTISAPVNNYKITPINNNHPIYFDEAGNLQLIHNEWKLLIYYNMTSYWQATSHIMTYTDLIDTTCKKMSHVPCEAMIAQLRHELTHLNEQNTLLKSHQSRQKRGYFDGIGKLSRTLFGTLDADFAEKYENDINYLQENEDHLLKLIKNQNYERRL